MKGCGGQALTCTNLRIPVVRHHMQEMIVIMEEVNHPHPHCLAFDMFVSWAEINHHHPIIALCLRGSNRKRQQLADQEAWAGVATELRVHIQKMETVTYLKYLGHLLTDMDDYCPAVIVNL